MSFSLFTIPFIILAIFFIFCIIVNGKLLVFLKYVFIAAIAIVCWPIGLALLLFSAVKK